MDVPMYHRLRELGYVVLCTDYSTGYDFLSNPMPNGFNNIICVPPRNNLDYVLHALSILRDGGDAIFFLPMVFLESRTRYDRLFRYYPPLYVFQCTERMGDETRGSYAWFIWKKGVKRKTILEWL